MVGGGGRLIRERNRPGEDLKRAGSPQVKISEPVPEAVDSKVGFIWFLLVTLEREEVLLLFISVYRAHGTQRPVCAVDKIRFVKYLNIFPFVLSRTITFQGSIQHVAPL